MSDPDGVETNVSSFANELSLMSSMHLLELVRDIKDQSQDALVIREVLLRLLRGHIGTSSLSSRHAAGGR